MSLIDPDTVQVYDGAGIPGSLSSFYHQTCQTSFVGFHKVRMTTCYLKTLLFEKNAPNVFSTRGKLRPWTCDPLIFLLGIFMRISRNVPLVISTYL